jgi:hypothetical protein
MKEAVSTSETLYRSTKRNIPEDSHIQANVIFMYFPITLPNQFSFLLYWELAWGGRGETEGFWEQGSEKKYLDQRGTK